MNEKRTQTIRVENGEAGFKIYSQIREGTITGTEMEDGHYETPAEAQKDLVFQKRALRVLGHSHVVNAYFTSGAIMADLYKSLAETGNQLLYQEAFGGLVFIIILNTVLLNDRRNELKRVKNKISAVDEALKQEEPEFKHTYTL